MYRQVGAKFTGPVVVLLTNDVKRRNTQMILFTCVHIIDANTLLTADVAAPVENAVALLLSLLSPCVVASAAAEEVAPVDAVRCQVADAIPCAKRSCLRIGIAEIG